jgi:hypothetical protein
VATRCRVIPGRPALLGGGGGLGGVVGESYHHGGFSLHPAPPELGSNSAWWECRTPRRCSAVEGWPSSRKCHGVLSSRIRSLGLPGAQEPPWLNPPRTPLVPNYSLNVASLQ